MLLLSVLCCLTAAGADPEEMTLREKVCQMFIIRPESLLCPENPLSLDVTEFCDSMADFFAKYPAGGFCLFPKNIVSPDQLAGFTASLHNLHPRPLLCIDEEGGRVARIANTGSFHLHRFKSMEALAAGGESHKVYNAARYIGTYVSKYGFDVDFAPVADVNTNPENVVIGARAFSDNPRTAAVMVVNYLMGLRDAGVIGCLKHFPGHGDTKDDTHTGYAATSKTWEEMSACEMSTFRAGIAAGAGMVMAAHIAAPEVTGSKTPSSLSATILQEKLRGELGFEGIIITDALEMGSIVKEYSSGEAAVEAVKAGADIILMPVDYVRAVEAVITAVKTGVIDESRIDASVRRILSLKRDIKP